MMHTPAHKVHRLAGVIDTIAREDNIDTIGRIKQITQRLRDQAFNIDPMDHDRLRISSRKAAIMGDLAALEVLLTRIKL